MGRVSTGVLLGLYKLLYPKRLGDQLPVGRVDSIVFRDSPENNWQDKKTIGNSLVHPTVGKIPGLLAKSGPYPGLGLGFCLRLNGPYYPSNGPGISWGFTRLENGRGGGVRVQLWAFSPDCL